jgi:hypothetical protein
MKQLDAVEGQNLWDSSGLHTDGGPDGHMPSLASPPHAIHCGTTGTLHQQASKQQLKPASQLNPVSPDSLESIDESPNGESISDTSLESDGDCVSAATNASSVELSSREFVEASPGDPSG